MLSSLRTSAPKMASMDASAARPAMKPQQLQKFSRAYSGASSRDSHRWDTKTDLSHTAATRASNPTAFNTLKRTSPLLSSAEILTPRIATQARRAYSSEMANALVQVSQNLGMGSAAIGLGGAGIGIGMVFAALLMAAARNPSLRGQLFSYAILGFAFVEAIGLFDLMVSSANLSCRHTAEADMTPGCHDVQIRLTTSLRREMCILLVLA